MLLPWIKRILISSLLIRLVQPSAFISRPDISAPTVTIHVNHLDVADDDLIFLTSWYTGHDGPYLFDLRGNLVWDGHSVFDEISATAQDLPSGSNVHNLHVVEYQGAPHLAYSTVVRNSQGLNTYGKNIIMNSSYAIVDVFGKPDGFTDFDPHEFELVDNGTAMLQTGRIRHSSTSPLSVNGEVGESVFQLVDMASKKVSFEWRSLDYVLENETCLKIPQLDCHHINSVDKDFQGNYIIDAYHACSIFKINGTDRSIIWRLGGDRSDFEMLDGYTLMHMHHVRIRDFADIRIPKELRGKVSKQTHLALSLFDNAFFALGKGVPTAASSSAIVVLLDLDAMTGQVIERYTHPQGMYGALFGSVQFLANGDRFIGWGGNRGFSQYTPNNELLLHAEIANAVTPTWSYRTFKAPWSARPTTQPDLHTYSWTCNWKTSMYVSWNGATDVSSWRFYGSSFSDGVFEELIVVGKDGFETRATAPAFAAYVYVEALRRDGSVLGQSGTVRTMVPRSEWAPLCNELRCYEGFDWSEKRGLGSCHESSAEVFRGMLAPQAVLM